MTVNDSLNPVTKKVRQYPVVEIFGGAGGGGVFEGEGPLAGIRIFYVRIGYCDFRCVEENQRVLMSDRTWKPIKDVKVGDCIMGISKDESGAQMKMRPAQVTASQSTGVRRVVEIHSGNNSVVVTPDHKFFYNEFRNFWCQAKSLEGKLLHSIPVLDQTDEYRRGWMAGYLRGDGNFHEFQDRWMRVKVVCVDPEPLDRLEAFGSLAGYQFRRIVHDSGNIKMKEKYPNAQTKIAGLEITNDSQVRALHAWLYEQDTSFDYARGWLGGMYDAEGYLDKQCRMSQSAVVHPDICAEIVSFAAEANVNISSWFDASKGMNTFLISNGTDFLFKTQPAILRKYPPEASIKTLSKTPSEVVEINREVPVWDISTEAESFICEGFIVHNCTGCDSMYAVMPSEVKATAKWLTASDILGKLINLKGDCGWVSVTGGNPALYVLDDLVDTLHGSNFKIKVETQGSVWNDWLGRVDMLMISPKTPGFAGEAWAEMNAKTFPDFLRKARTAKVPYAVKVVIATHDDIKYARRLAEENNLEQLWLSCYTDSQDTRDDLGERFAMLGELIQEEFRNWGSLDLRWSFQQHVMAYGHKRGV